MTSPLRTSPRLAEKSPKSSPPSRAIAKDDCEVESRRGVWASAWTMSGPARTYYYLQRTGTTTWVLPDDAILRQSTGGYSKPPAENDNRRYSGYAVEQPRSGEKPKKKRATPKKSPTSPRSPAAPSPAPGPSAAAIAAAGLVRRLPPRRLVPRSRSPRPPLPFSLFYHSRARAQVRGELGLVRGELDEMRADNERTIAATIAETRDEVLALAAAATEKLAAREGALRTEIKLEQAAVVRTQLQEDRLGASAARWRRRRRGGRARRATKRRRRRRSLTAHLEAAKEAAEAAMEESEAARIAAVEARELQIDELEQRAETVRQLEDEVQTLKGNVKVFARVRPMKPAEEHACGAAVSVAAAKDGIPRRLLVTHAAQGVGAEAAAASARPFDFDRVFGADVNAETLFAELKPMVTRVAGGAKATVLAYGQTGSGKTFTSSAIHTMAGAELLNLGCTVSFAALEVYNERAVDLLSTSARNKLEHHLDGLTAGRRPRLGRRRALARRGRRRAPRHRRQRPQRGLVSLAPRLPVPRVDHVWRRRGEERPGRRPARAGRSRGVGAAQADRGGGRAAGGGRADQQVSLGDWRRGGGAAKGRSTPYRNAKLTHILQPYLERGCRVGDQLVMASPAVADAAETANALTFGARARSVTLGQARDAAGGTATRARREVTRLKRLLLESRQAAVAHERAADEERAKLAAAEEKMEKAAEAAKAAEARAKAAEAGVSKEDAAAAKEKAALQKEVGELKRKLAAALARAERPTPTNTRRRRRPPAPRGRRGARRAPRPTSARSARRPPPTMPPPPTPPVALAGAAAAGARRRAAGRGVGRRGGGGGGGAAVVDEEAKGLAEQQAELPGRNRRRLWRRHGRRERADDCGGGRRRDGGAAAAARPQLGDAADAVAAQDDAAQAELLRHPRHKHPRLDRGDAAARRRGGPLVVVVALRREGGARPPVGGARRRSNRPVTAPASSSKGLSAKAAPRRAADAEGDAQGAARPRDAADAGREPDSRVVAQGEGSSSRGGIERERERRGGST